MTDSVWILEDLAIVKWIFLWSVATY
jgi:hypothetical protein